jgi:hypothetical protein
MRAADRFSELMRAMAKEESDAALAVFFDQPVTTINNWCKGAKAPRDIRELVERCGISYDELLLADEQSWRSVVEKVLSTRRVLVMPGWLHSSERLAFVERSTQSPAIIILTADAYNDTQRRKVQSSVRSNILRGINYFYVIPNGCEYERSLARFVETLNSAGAQGGSAGTAKILRTHTIKKTTRQWKRIDHVVLFARVGEDVSKIEYLSDIPHLQISAGYEQLYKAGDRPFDDRVWKTLSIREIDYYKELLEEWSITGGADEITRPGR